MAEESRSTFDFSDQFGSDPIVRRYRPTNLVDIRGAEAGAREAAATRELAEANLSKVQAELTAQMAPMKTGLEMVTTMSELMKNRAALQEESAIKTAAAAISEGLGNPNLDLKGVSQLVAGSNAIGLRDEQVGLTVRSLLLDKFKQSTDNAESPYEVDRVFSLLPATVAGDPMFVAARTGALSQANLRQGVMKSSAAEPNLGPVPVTPEGLIDVPKAEINIAAEAGVQDRRKAAQENLRFVQPQIDRLRTKESDGSMTNEERLQLKDLEARVPGLIAQMFDGTEQRLGGGGEDTSDLDAAIGGGAATPPTTATTTTTATEPPTVTPPPPAAGPVAGPTPQQVLQTSNDPLELAKASTQSAEQTSKAEQEKERQAYIARIEQAFAEPPTPNPDVFQTPKVKEIAASPNARGLAQERYRELQSAAFTGGLRAALPKKKKEIPDDVFEKVLAEMFELRVLLGESTRDAQDLIDRIRSNK